MAIQTLMPGPNTGGQLGAALGQGFGVGGGSALGGLLEGLAEAKAQELQQSQLQKAFKGLGLNNNQAQALSGLDPKLQQLFLSDFLAQPTQQAYAQALGLGAPQELQLQQAVSPQQQINVEPLKGLQALELLQGKIPPSMFSQQPQIQQPQQVAQQIPQQNLPRLTERQATEIAKIRREEAKEQRKLAQEEKKQVHKERLESFKHNKEQIKDITEKAKLSRQTINDLDRMEELDKTGNLDGPGFDAWLTESGLDVATLRSPESQEFKKIAQNFLRNAKQYYGGRVSNFEVEQFLKTIPSLSQSPEGRKRVIANLKNIARADLEYNKALRDIIKENKGSIPLDLAIQVDERVEKQAKKLADQFKKDLDRPVPPPESKGKTYAGVLGGKAARFIGKEAPAIIGGGIGALLGGLPGAAAGGVLGKLGANLFVK